MKHRILVTGAHGTVGSEVVRLLEAKNADFVAASLGQHAHATDIRALQVDFKHVGLLETAFQGIEVVFLALPMAPEMVDYARNVAQAARRAGVQHIVHLSMLGADIGSPYLVRQIQAKTEEVLRQSGIGCTWIRPNSFMQNFVNFYGEDISTGVLYLPEGEGRTSFVDVRDVAEIATRVLLSPTLHRGLTYDVTGARAISNAEVTSLISLSVVRRVSYVPVTEDAAREVMKRMEWSLWKIEVILSLHRVVHEGQAEGVTHVVEMFTGRQPRSIEDFVMEVRQRWDLPKLNRTADLS